MPRILAIADEEDRSLTYRRIREIGADVVVSCGDLPADYLEYVVTAANRPLLYVPGNHDPDFDQARLDTTALTTAAAGPFPGVPGIGYAVHWETPPGPGGCTRIDRRVAVAAGLRIGGLGGSIRYRPGPNQYTQRQMRRRARRLILRAKLRHSGLDVFIAHSPPAGLGDAADDAHRGFEAFHRILDTLRPALMLHGHIHPHGFPTPDRSAGPTRIMNVIPSRVIDL